MSFIPSGKQTKNPTLELVPILSFGVGGHVYLFIYFKFGSSFSLKVSRSAGYGIGTVCFICVQLCLPLLKGSWSSKIPNEDLSSSFEERLPCLYCTGVIHLLNKNGKYSDTIAFFLMCDGGVFFNQHFIQSHLLSSWTPEQIILAVPVVVRPRQD